MKKWIIGLCALLLFSSCERKEVEKVMVISGQLEQGADSCDIRVYSLENESLMALDEAVVKVEIDGVNYAFENVGNGVYRSTEIIEHLHDFTDCHVIINHSDYKECTADVKIPKSTGVVYGTYSYSVNVNLPEEECLEVVWPNEPGQNYFFELDYIDSDFDEIPFDGSSGLFDTHFDGPQMGHHLVIVNNDFQYYGVHRLVLKAVDDQYLEAHYYASADEMGLLQAGNSNVRGGKGLITGCSRSEMLIEIIH